MGKNAPKLHAKGLLLSHNDEITANFDGNVIISEENQNLLGINIDSKLSFSDHVKHATSKSIKGLNVLRKLHHYLPRKTLITIYKSFIRPHLDYGDVIYDQPSNNVFSNKIETIQYNCALAITGAIKGTSREKLYQELGLDYLSQRCGSGGFLILIDLYQGCFVLGYLY